MKKTKKSAKLFARECMAYNTWRIRYNVVIYNVYYTYILHCSIYGEREIDRFLLACRNSLEVSVRYVALLLTQNFGGLKNKHFERRKFSRAFLSSRVYRSSKF